MADPFGPYAIPGFGSGIAPFQPGGYATLVSGQVVHTADQASKTIVYYTQDAHNAFPIIKNGTRHAVYFDEPRLVLSSAHAANGLYDVFGTGRNGKGHLVSGPIWTTGGGSVTAGSCARGTGGGSTELARAGGMYVNRWGVAGLNGDGSQFINPGEGCYLFSIFIDGTDGQITCHRDWGQSRKWGIWNAHNRRPAYLKAGDSTASWSYTTNTIRASNDASNNKVTVFAGLADEYVYAEFVQKIDIEDVSSGLTIMQAGIGVNSTTAFSGTNAEFGVDEGSAASAAVGLTPQLRARHFMAPALGINALQALERTTNAGNPNTYFGTEANMLLSAQWRA